MVEYISPNIKKLKKKKRFYKLLAVSLFLVSVKSYSKEEKAKATKVYKDVNPSELVIFSMKDFTSSLYKYFIPESNFQVELNKVNKSIFPGNRIQKIIAFKKY